MLDHIPVAHYEGPFQVGNLIFTLFQVFRESEGVSFEEREMSRL